MKLFHRTFAAEAILREGFRDSRGRIEDLVLEGVWLSDRPLEEQDGARGNALLVVEIPEPDLADFEVVEEGEPYREWCVPAVLVNRFGPVREATGADADSWPGWNSGDWRWFVGKLRAMGRHETADNLEHRAEPRPSCKSDGEE